MVFLRLRETEVAAFFLRALDRRARVAAFFRRAGLSTLRLAALPAARLIAGADCVSFAFPLASAAAVLSSTTSVAAFAAAPSASPATVFTPLAPRCAALAIACLALVVIRTIFRLPPCRLNNAAATPEFHNRQEICPQWPGSYMRWARNTLWWLVSGARGFRLKRSPAGRMSHNCSGWDRFRYYSTPTTGGQYFARGNRDKAASFRNHRSRDGAFLLQRRRRNVRGAFGLYRRRFQRLLVGHSQPR